MKWELEIAIVAKYQRSSKPNIRWLFETGQTRCP